VNEMAAKEKIKGDKKRKGNGKTKENKK